MKRPFYREQGNRLYKVTRTHTIEVNLEEEVHGHQLYCVGINLQPHIGTRVDSPNKHANVISKAEFMKEFNRVQELIKKAMQ